MGNKSLILALLLLTVGGVLYGTLYFYEKYKNTKKGYMRIFDRIEISFWVTLFIFWMTVFICYVVKYYAIELVIK
jgi:hypothetical protein